MIIQSDPNQQLRTELKIHCQLSHPNIVALKSSFRDSDNVYMVLELCSNGSLMDMVKRRKRLTEPEARFFMVQLIGACEYMHTCRVIHHDLKPANILLDKEMNVKVCDFGLADQLTSLDERKMSICGTPNYVAPEVMFDSERGHGFEADVWSLGVVLYNMLVGRAPFHAKTVNETYE